AGSLKTIGVIGPNADSRAALVGNYHGTSSEYITVLEGIRRLAGENTRILYSQGCDLWRKNVENLSCEEGGDRLSEAAIVCDYSDLVILVVGLDETMEGEEGDTGNADASGDKLSLSFPESQRRMMEQVLSCSKPVIVINMTGSAMDLRLADEKAAALLQVWYPGARGGLDVAGLLFGQFAPSGKLPLTFYRSTDDLPDFRDYSMENRTYRYYRGVPLYPFGYGLTYGKLEIEKLKAAGLVPESPEAAACAHSADAGAPAPAPAAVSGSASDDLDRDYLELELIICNPGGKEVTDVLQIYIKDEEYTLAVPNPSLCWKGRVSVPAGESIIVRPRLRRRAFSSVDKAGERRVRSRSFSIYAGFSQPDERSASLTGQRCLKLDYRE
nr:glycoside hydrolase family 3 C-terminal domain-containing protein [Lachnospiraceae bacterium]